MPYDISVDENARYIIINVTGEINNSIALEMTIKSHQLGNQINIDRYFVDLRDARNMQSVVDNYKFAYEDMAGLDSINRNAIAVMLVSPDDSSHDFIETVTINSGLNVRKFTDYQEAIKYLTK
jgi:hypothetical protein